MDKNIIIDGVDVAGCEYFNKFRNICHNKNLSCDCEKNQDCYYKQLKRLEEKYNKMVEISKENLIKYEDLRLDNQKLIIEIEGLKSQIDFEAQKQAILLQENEELKARLQPFEDSYFNGLSSIEIAGLAKKSIRITSYNRELKTALVDIREMLPESKCKYACFSCPESGQCKEEWAEPIKRIIPKAIGE